jgi:hypothetical protein
LRDAVAGGEANVAEGFGRYLVSGATGPRNEAAIVSLFIFAAN